MISKFKKAIILKTIFNKVFVILLIIVFSIILGIWIYNSFEKENKQLPSNKTKTEDKTISDYFGNKFIQINFPQKNAIIKSPILVSGKANVFEANIRVRIKDKNRNILADDFITASGWMDNLYPFKKEINYTNPTSQNGVIDVFGENAKDGSEIHLVKIPVIFKYYKIQKNYK